MHQNAWKSRDNITSKSLNSISSARRKNTSRNSVRRSTIRSKTSFSPEISNVSLEDCVKYIEDLVIKKTLEGYQRENETVRGLPEKQLETFIRPAPDEWDKRYNVDYYIEISVKCIALQIKPLSYKQAPESHKWIESQRKMHEEFQKKYVARCLACSPAAKKAKRNCITRRSSKKSERK